MSSIPIVGGLRMVLVLIPESRRGAGPRPSLRDAPALVAWHPAAFPIPGAVLPRMAFLPRRAMANLAPPLPSTLALLTALGAVGAPAQGITWVDGTAQPTLHIRELADGDWALTFDGWSTTATGPLLGGDEAAAVGTNYGARTVRATESDFLRGGTGGETPAAPLFPFVVDAGVAPLFAARSSPFLVWFGFRATIAGPVPEHGMGSLGFRVGFQSPHTASSALSALADAHAGVAKVDPQGNPTGRVALLRAARVRLASIAYYKFDRGAGDTEVNFAGIEGGALGLATLRRPSGIPWVPGRFDTALRAGTSCDTGYRGDLGGRFTVAWFMKERVAPAAESPVFTLGNWRCFTAGNAGSGLRCVGWGGLPAVLDLPDDVQALARTNWVHVALVVDSDRGQAAWFVNGSNRRTIGLNASNGQVRIPADPTPLIVGGSACAYDLDEFRLLAEAADVPAIANWANDSPAAAQPFSLACGANLRHAGQPLLGSTLQYRIEAEPQAATGLFLGAVARPPLDLGFLGAGLQGCPWYGDFAFALPAVVVPSSGLAVLGLSIPNQVELRGLELYDQALVLERSFTWRASNAHALSLR